MQGRWLRRLGLELQWLGVRLTLRGRWLRLPVGSWLPLGLSAGCCSSGSSSELYQQPGGGSASSNENSWNWMRPEGTPNGNSANPQQQQQPPPSHGAWGSESVPPTALVWPPPRPDPWAASIQPQQVCSLKMTLRWRHLSKEIETHLTCMRPK